MSFSTVWFMRCIGLGNLSTALASQYAISLSKEVAHIAHAKADFRPTRIDKLNTSNGWVMAWNICLCRVNAVWSHWHALISHNGEIISIKLFFLYLHILSFCWFIIIVLFFSLHQWTRPASVLLSLESVGLHTVRSMHASGNCSAMKLRFHSIWNYLFHLFMNVKPVFFTQNAQLHMYNKTHSWKMYTCYKKTTQSVLYILASLLSHIFIACYCIMFIDIIDHH